jgi:hypothetical protein
LSAFAGDLALFLFTHSCKATFCCCHIPSFTLCWQLLAYGSLTALAVRILTVTTMFF